ncbi:hypothetical protein [Fredinandcohnia sp. 179-A 10B2 NHS]|uniref:hypothetical protein n=1 Tax=Fredinandcohnia sp. 179-A 10B2 NHS TaxID=3235176 RepID=UPI0039A04FD3
MQREYNSVGFKLGLKKVKALGGCNDYVSGKLEKNRAQIRQGAFDNMEEYKNDGSR